MHVIEYSEQKIALGGPVTLSFSGAFSVGEVRAIFAGLWRMVVLFEKQFSRFLSSSEVSLLNRRAGRPTGVSSPMLRLLKAALKQAKESQGLYNPLVLPAMHREGYRQSVLEMRGSSVPDYSRRIVADPADIVIIGQEVCLPVASALDFGGCGKGYLADQLGVYLRKKGVSGYWLELSGDIAAYGQDAHGSPLQVALQDAQEPTRQRQDIVIACPRVPFGIATSGTLLRPEHAGVLKTHHIIDPRTNKPAVTDVVLATVCAPKAIDADVLASSAVILGSRDADQMLRHSKALAWVLQYKTKLGQPRTVQFGSAIHKRVVKAHA